MKSKSIDLHEWTSFVLAMFQESISRFGLMWSNCAIIDISTFIGVWDH
jgi:hypothetical protein